MSLLDAIQAKKSQLARTTTIVTKPDGRKFVESGNSLEELADNTSFGFVVDEAPDNVPAKILEHLYLGSQDCCEPDVVKSYCISHVLSVGIEATNQLDYVLYKFVPCLDVPESNVEQLLNNTVPFIESVLKDEGNNILIHCNAGVSRSATVVIGFLMLKRNYSFVEAYKHVKSVRNCVQPNSGFQQQLKRLLH